MFASTWTSRGLQYLLNQEMVGAFSSGPFLTRVLASARGHSCALSAPVEEKVIYQFRKQDHSWANAKQQEASKWYAQRLPCLWEQSVNKVNEDIRRLLAQRVLVVTLTDFPSYLQYTSVPVVIKESSVTTCLWEQSVK